ncbi:MAG: hypothetical protein ACOYB3_05505 [Azonexus sp.]
MKIIHAFTGKVYDAHLVYQDGTAHPGVFVTGVAEALDPFYFGIAEATPQELEALSPGWREVVEGARS